jgi:GNAT superfamily N-acetyltransferase
MSDADLISRLDEALGDAGYLRSAELARTPGNPLHVQQRRFGRVHARRIPVDLAYYRYFSGPRQLTADDVGVLPDLIAWYRAAAAPLVIRAPLGAAVEAALTRSGFTREGELNILSATRATFRRPAVATAEAEELAHDRREVFCDLWTADVADASERAVRRALAEREFAHWRTYIARIDGQAVAHAAMCVLRDQRCAVLGAGATHPSYRRRGCQTALIVRRVEDALAAGCALVAVETSAASQSERNLQRLGFSVFFARGVWRL